MKIFNVCLILLFLVFGFIACDPNNGNNDPVCECIEKIHEGNCPSPCTGKGIPPCTCSDPEPVCNCPNETNHYVDEEPCCNNLNCSCTFTKKRDCNCTINLHLVGEICCDVDIYNCNCEVNVNGARLNNGVPVIILDNVTVSADDAVQTIENALDYIEGEGFIEHADYIRDNISIINIIAGENYFEKYNFIVNEGNYDELIFRGSYLLVIKNTNKNILIISEYFIKSSGGSYMIGDQLWDVADLNMPAAYLDNGIIIVLTYGVSVSIELVIQKIEEAFDEIKSWEEIEHANFARDNIKLIRIYNNTSSIANVIFENGKWIALISNNAINSVSSHDIIGTAFWEFADNNM